MKIEVFQEFSESYGESAIRRILDELLLIVTLALPTEEANNLRSYGGIYARKRIDFS